MKARAAPRDISSHKQNMPASGDGTANEYPRNHLQGNVRSTSRVPSRIRARTESAQEFGRYHPLSFILSMSAYRYRNYLAGLQP